ncbi:dTMP kinase [Paenibacillus pini]|uniref:Thymidylate kinase n=1 Tax=Paenibacillus pini JCM 16418 TaxID=1236976 RepID=W7Z897_9BACL|nr:dTMP kinase [Paenibacillus pini]GAF10629.1 thymidylate kinase [Paenibacillus pini JCM 16418]
MSQRGKFITLEGGEGSGKTTVTQLLAAYLEKRSLPFLVTREPGGIHIAEQIREIILNPAHTMMDGRTEALLYAAARRQHLVEKVEPALLEGTTVLCDRFVDSSLAYQGHARGIGINEVWNINQFAIHSLLPDITFYLDIDPEEGLARIAASHEREVNRLDLEGLPFHNLVREGYQQIAALFPERIVVIDASKKIEEVANDMIRRLEEGILKDF